jgi:CheY-like chemotaxis protein
MPTQPDQPKEPRRLRMFLCHSAGDKPAVRDLYRRLRADGVDPWLDEEALLPGQDWDREIRKAVRAADVILVCLSCGSVTKAGYVQKEIKFALDVADEQPEGTIFLIPLRLEECDVPERLSRWQWVDLFDARGYEDLMRALRLRAKDLGVTLTLPLVDHQTTVLIIEDEDAVREIEERILTSNGIAVLAASRGEEGIKMAQVHRPDLILLDLMMPGMSGKDVAHALKSNPATAYIPVLVVSAHSDWQTIEETYALGVVDFLTKPFEYQELLSRVRRALKVAVQQAAGSK